MACENMLKPGQTLTQRKAEVRKVVDLVSAGMLTGRIKARKGPTGAIAFDGLTAAERDNVTDPCIYRLTMLFGNAVAKQKLAALGVNKASVAAGHHAHGDVWHTHKG